MALRSGCVTASLPLYERGANKLGVCNKPHTRSRSAIPR